jgi:hypothetical protein
LLTIIVLLVSFLVNALLQHITQAKHHELVKNTGSEAKVSNLNSFSLALLLGGLRGPLVMMLWSSSETQKQEKDLEDFDSKIELIRLLQSEFRSVHLFQMWNKAYNVSVQMANKPNKYATIVDAIEYGYKTDAQLPNDINILSQIGQIFFDKLGNSQEKDYYTDRICRESFPDEKITVPADRVSGLEAILSKAGIDPARRDVMVQQATHNGWFTANKLSADAIRPLLDGPGVSYSVAMPAIFSETGRRLRLDPMLQLDGKLLDSKTTPIDPRPAGLSAAEEWNDGSELQYLKKFAPFPYGIPPMAIGWNYYKRCQVLKDQTKQKHLQLSDAVVDNRPAINGKLWGESEWNLGRRAEMKAFGLPLPLVDNTAEARSRIETPTAAFAQETPFTDPAAAKEAAHHYDQVTKIGEESIREFDRHLRHYAANDFRSNRDSVIAMWKLCDADRDYLRAMLLPAGDASRDSLLKDCAAEYTTAMLKWEVLMLKHYVSDGAAQKLYPNFKVTRDTLEETLSPKEIHKLTFAVQKYLQQNPQFDTDSDRHEAERSFGRAYRRLVQLKAAPELQ